MSARGLSSPHDNACRNQSIGHEIDGLLHWPDCGHGKRLDMDMLIERFGTDYEMVNERRIGVL